MDGDESHSDGGLTNTVEVNGEVPGELGAGQAMLSKKLHCDRA